MDAETQKSDLIKVPEHRGTWELALWFPDSQPSSLSVPPHCHYNLHEWERVVQRKRGRVYYLHINNRVNSRWYGKLFI